MGLGEDGGRGRGRDEERMERRGGEKRGEMMKRGRGRKGNGEV